MTTQRQPRYRWVPRRKRERLRDKARGKFWGRFKGPMDCAHCGTPVSRRLPEGHPSKATIDHLVPISRGGKSAHANLALACHACNNDRGSKRRWRGERVGRVEYLVAWLAVALASLRFRFARLLAPSPAPRNNGGRRGRR